MTFVDPGLLETLGIYGGDQQTFVNENPGLTLGTPPAPPVAGAVGGLSTNTAGGKAILLSILRQAGIDTPDVIAYVTDLVTQGGTVSDWQARLNADLYDPATTVGKVVAEKYPEIAARKAGGWDPVSIGEVLDYRNTAQQVARAEGYPVELLDFTKLMGQNVGTPELQRRIQTNYAEVQRALPEVVDQLHTLYGLSPGEIAAMVADPNETADHFQRRFDAATIGAAGNRTGYGQISAATGEHLAALGVTADQAQAGFGNLAQMGELFNPLPGEPGAGGITQEQQLAATFDGDANAQKLIEQERARRKASFAGRGGFGATQAGIGGLGRADQP